jgi:hypothetical protein
LLLLPENPDLASGIIPAMHFARRCAVCAMALAGCTVHLEPPSRAPADATGGHAPRAFDPSRACGHWGDAVGPGGLAATSHISFPELDPEASCFVPVRYAGAAPRADPIPPGCGYPRSDLRERTRALVEKRAERYEKIAAGTPDGPPPLELACALPPDAQRSAARANARTIRALSARLGAGQTYPYAAVSAFGYGFAAQSKSPLVRFRPGDACPAPVDGDMALFDSNFMRAARAAEAYAAGIAPVVIVSGGAIHSDLTEAFLLTYLLACRFAVPEDAILLDPCANHTHTNVRNTGSLVLAIGGRTAYLVTDDSFQARYLEEYTALEFIFGSIDQRSLRDFGYLLGSYRRASVGMKAGFWYTPYRFWAEPVDGLGGFTCIP